MKKTNVSSEVLILTKKSEKTDTPGSMKKTNVSSEVLILPKNLEKCAPRRTPVWAPKLAPK